jgi:hypothetical protein
MILNPQSMEESFDEQNEYRSQKEERLRRRMEINKRQPELPISMKGRNGRVNTREVEEIMKRINKDTTRSEDPREALLKQDEEAKANPYWIDRAYKDSGPKILSKRVFETEEEERQNNMKKRRQ